MKKRLVQALIAISVVSVSLAQERVETLPPARNITKKCKAPADGFVVGHLKGPGRGNIWAILKNESDDTDLLTVGGSLRDGGLTSFTLPVKKGQSVDYGSSGLISEEVNFSFVAR